MGHAVDQLVRADLVVTTGGVSMGAYDVVKEELSKLGTVDFPQVAMQPGKPQGFGVSARTRCRSSRCPATRSAYVSFEVFVRPAMRKLMGQMPYRPDRCAGCRWTGSARPGAAAVRPRRAQSGDGAGWPVPVGGARLPPAGRAGRGERTDRGARDVTAVRAGDQVELFCWTGDSRDD